MSAEHTILVGVDGSRASNAAVRYAAVKARQDGSDVSLIHVRPDYLAVAPMMPIAPIDLEPSSRELLAGAAKVAAEILPDARIHTLLADGPRVVSIVHVAADADLVVLGAERHATLERLLTGSTLFGVAGSAPCPVVAVPEAWSPTETERHRIAVAVRSVDQAPELVRQALELAEGRQATVVLVHAWELPGEYDDLISRRIHERTWGDRARADLTAAVKDLVEAHPGVPLEVRVVHGQPARVLAEASEDADALLLARRRHMLFTHHLGGTARAVMRASGCPVVVCPPVDARPDETADVARSEPAHV